MAEADGVMVHKRAKLHDVLAEMRYRRLQSEIEGHVEKAQEQLNWFQRCVPHDGGH